MKRTSGLHEDLSREEAVQGSSDRSFGFVFAALFAVIGFGPLVRGHDIRWWSVALAVVFLAIAAVRPSLLKPLNRLWLAFGLLLHRPVNLIVMGLLFYAVITPMAVLMRLLGKDLLRLAPTPGVASYWIARTPPGPAPDSMSRQF